MQIYFGKKENWTINQEQRAFILFKKYPHIQQAYQLTLSLINIYAYKNMELVKIKFTLWIEEVLEKETKEFYTVANSVKNNLENILIF